MKHEIPILICVLISVTLVAACDESPATGAATPTSAVPSTPTAGDIIIYPSATPSAGDGSDIVIYPRAYLVYRDYVDVIGGRPAMADKGVIEGTVVSLTMSQVCPYEEEECSIEPYPRDRGVVRVDGIASYTAYTEGDTETPVEQSGEPEPAIGDRTSGSEGATRAPDRDRDEAFKPLQEGDEVPSLFLLTARPAEVVYVTPGGSEGAESTDATEAAGEDTAEATIQPGRRPFQPIPREEGRWVFTKLGDSRESLQLPGLEVGSTFRAHIRYDGTLYVEEYELVP